MVSNTFYTVPRPHRRPQVFIHGSCVGRDTFEWLRDDFRLLAYIARQSFISTDSDARLDLLAEAPFDSRFQERMRLGDAAGDASRRLGAFGGDADLILLDLCDERLGVYETQRNSYVTDSVERRRRDPLPFGKVPFGNTQHLHLWQQALGRWLERARTTAPNATILVIGLQWATVTDSGKAAPPSYDLTAEAGNATFDPYYGAVSRLGLRIVGRDIRAIAAEGHKWGSSPFHYTDEVYKALAAEIRTAHLSQRLAVTSYAQNATRHPREDLSRTNLRPVQFASEPKRYPSLEDFLARASNPTGSVELLHRGLPFHFFFQRRDSDVTLVTFGGTISGRVKALPAWSGLHLTSDIAANRILISDPSLILDDNLRLGWYAGNTIQHTLQDDLTAFIAHVSRGTRLLFFGASGGGFASLVQAARIPGSTAIVSNPHTNISKYTRAAVERYLKVAWGIDGLPDETVLPFVSNAIDLWRHPVASRLIYIQNSGDSDHMAKHFRPFVQQCHRSNRVTVRTPDLGIGHVGPDKGSLRRLLRVARESSDWATMSAEVSNLVITRLPDSDPDMTRQEH